MTALRALLPVCGGLAVSLAAALACVALHTPLPWMIGPMLAVAATRVAGWPVDALPGGRQAAQWIIGTALGLYFSPLVAQRVSGFVWLLVLGAIFAIAVGYLCGYLLSVLGGTDRTTAVFASVPGGAAEMAVLGERFGARVDQVAAAQSVRILLVVVTIPSVFAALGLHGADAFLAATSEVRLPALAVLLSLTAAAGLLLTRRNVPNAFVLGALAVTIPLTIAGVSTSAMPRVLLNGAQLLLGCALGARFNRSFLARAPRFVAAVVVTVAVAMGVSVLFAWFMARLTGLHPATLILATAPGGIAEMAVTAQILELGVPMVTSFHVTRVILLLTCTGPLFAWLRHRRRRARARRGPVA
ncbi:MAG TPA: AbrB family transcriptional regulator [Casimicrobiaceae bacterium]